MRAQLIKYLLFAIFIQLNSGHDDTLARGGEILRLVSRDEWIAQPPSKELEPMQLPATKVIIAHTATEGCDTQAMCTFRIRLIQTFHMESRNWDDIAYNFLVGGDGLVYEGRGWDKVGVHTNGFNRGSIGIAFVGTFTKIAPSTKQLRAAQMIIAEGVRLGKLSTDYKLYGHRQLIASESPGEELYKIIKLWPHWSNQIEES
uniref:Peptidoglycan-recognition protein n=1 Tax=Dolopus genitalis TaxID=2488630 RepID=A0A3G5BIL6_DOLGE|nr:venom polypeptide [Dolopus genitalis]